MNGAYYNEHDPFAAAWLRRLIARGLIAPGDVDDRDIQFVQPDDLRGYAQCHFFAGIGGWSYALRLAGWDDARPVWTGSCPCQPFSSAGKGEGFEDPRHLWPAWFRLIRECRPPVVFGEQVASKDGLAWLDHVSTDLEATDYAFGAADLCAAGVRAPHIRQRLFYVADGDHARRGAGWPGQAGDGRDAARVKPSGLRATDGLADSERWASERHGLDVGGEARGTEGRAQERERLRPDAGDGGVPVVMGYSDHAGPQGRRGGRDGSNECAPWASGMADRGDAAGDEQREPREREEGDGRPGEAGGPWDDLAWLPCRDGKLRPTKPGLFPLAHGIPGRVGLLRGAGNAIVPQVAEAFIRAYREAVGE